MALFNLPNRSSRDQDMALIKKTKVTTQTAATTGGSLLAKINEIKALVEKNLGKFRENYIILQTLPEYETYLRRSIDNKIIVIDTETTGLDPMQDKIVGICIYTPDEKPAYIPINHISLITGERVDGQLTEVEIAPMLTKVAESETKVIMFNANFDIRVLRNQLGVYLTCYWDCYLAARLLNENEGQGNNNLKTLHKKYILNGEGDAFSFDEFFNGISFDKIPIQVGYLYAAHDAIITYELYEYQRQFLYYDPACPPDDRNGLNGVSWLFFNIEMACLPVVVDMEDAGVAFDNAYAQKLAVKYRKLLEDKKQNFYSLCDKFGEKLDEYRARQGIKNKLEYPINISSASQIAIMLYDVLGVDPVDTKNPRGTGEAILAKIDHPIAKAILEYREVYKLLSTYIEKLPTCVNPKDGRIHCRFNQYGADTGRFSSDRPNLQNIPSHNKDIRKMFIASPGYVLMSSDYSQQEPKVMTQMCQDPKMIQAYQDGKDLYAEIASLSFNTSYEQCLEFNPDGTTNKDGKARRSQAKSILLGVLYGRGVPSIAEQLGVQPEKAQRIKDSVFKGFPAIPKFEQDSLKMAYELGYVTTLWGRKRRLPDLQLDEFEFRWRDGAPPDNDLLDFDSEDGVDEEQEVPEGVRQKYLAKLRRCRFGQKRKVFEEANKEGIWIIDNGAKIAEAQRQCVNARIQGSAADMSKLAMISVWKDKTLKTLGFRLLIPIHDELIGECPEENAAECKKRFAELMEEAAKGRLELPIKCDVAVSREWYGKEVVV